MSFNALYYHLKPLLPRRIQIKLRRFIVERKRVRYSNVWPIDERVGKSPEGWKGWPENKTFALVLTHDVDTDRGQERCLQLAELEENIGFRSSFNFVPRRYPVSQALREELVGRGFEVGVHGLYHDGNYYRFREEFRKRAEQINHFLKEWDSVGFRSPSMYHNLEWIHDLNIEYDASTFDTDPFEPQSDGIRTIFPFYVRKGSGDGGYIELPYTLAQDFTLFVLMQERDITIWKEKLDWVAQKGGMALLNVHPDYMAFSGRRMTIEEYPADYYRQFLEYVGGRYKEYYWNALPREISLWVRKQRAKSAQTLNLAP